MYGSRLKLLRVSRLLAARYIGSWHSFGAVSSGGKADRGATQIVGFGGARAFSAQDARGTSSKLIFYGTPVENTVEFVRGFASLQTQTEAHIITR